MYKYFMEPSNLRVRNSNMLHNPANKLRLPDALLPLAGLIGQAESGIAETGIAGIRLFWTTRSMPPTPQVYDPGIVLILHGRKEGTFDGRPLRYDEDHYLTLTLPAPFVCGHIASDSEPLIGLFIDAVREDILSLLEQMDIVDSGPPSAGAVAIQPAPVSASMRLTITRLIAYLADPVSVKVLGPQLRREFLFHVLHGPRGSAFAAYARQNVAGGRLDILIDTVSQEFRNPINIDGLASKAGMSSSNFHRAFRRRTGQSPLQYIKRLRLLAARQMIQFNGTRVGEAAHRVGYENVSQFSREYRRYFGVAASVAKSTKAKTHHVF
ncbi:Transcriptional regulator, AraC family [Devosia sp. LC5]|uniref:AraC family transcriptional regulator n=1 Tax=Devosia sp. LC5 TaxID=1502724 RepID=UPI0004E2F706|nr:AraC family transcriptional regulator N-terminal domain-containing protein [Devosia sp. LC5]KFC62066.1 Transcriptional regulator, AraC family [Devosia sp. LC5]